MEVKEGIGKAKMYDLLAFIAAKQSLENECSEHYVKHFWERYFKLRVLWVTVGRLCKNIVKNSNLIQSKKPQGRKAILALETFSFC